MHRFIARFALLVTLAGSLGPLALAITAAPRHACCVRKAVHSCHDALGDPSGQRAIHDDSCCNRNPGRAVVKVQWAHTQPLQIFSIGLNLEREPNGPSSIFRADELFGSNSGRSPPSFHLA